MSHLTSLTRVATATLLTLALGSACGGKSFQGGDDGTSGAGGSSSPGGSSSAIAGKAALGGSSSSAGTGMVAGTTSVGGFAGNPATDACWAPVDPGPCNAYSEVWYHDGNTGVCRPFVYGGCGGNPNRYDSLAACQKACPGGSPNYDVCKQPSDCMVTGSSCCGVCDGPSLSKHDFVAYNAMFEGLQCVSTLKDLPAPGAPAEPVECPGCPEIMGGFLKYFVPDCVENACTVVDLRDPQFTACMTSEECTYRYGTGCCQSCNQGDAIPLRKDAPIGPLVCGDEDIACAPCPEPDPKQVPHPVCSGGRCELTYIAF